MSVRSLSICGVGGIVVIAVAYFVVPVAVGVVVYYSVNSRVRTSLVIAFVTPKN